MICQKKHIKLPNHFQEKSPIILIPQGFDPFIFSNQWPISFYEIGKKGLVVDNYNIDKTQLIYAPSLIGTWLLYKINWKEDPNVKLLIDKNTIINKYSKIFMVLYLTYEKFRLGSDVPSPIMRRILYREGLFYPLLNNINISEWLACFKIAKIYDEHVVKI